VVVSYPLVEVEDLFLEEGASFDQEEVVFPFKVAHLKAPKEEKAQYFVFIS
jgi:hypothetical protein